ncbi:MAG: hypothetical protein IKA56_00265 [Clostridia bacterium]|nr:hypothetical protein [Clostridia bacterium]
MKIEVILFLKKAMAYIMSLILMAFPGLGGQQTVVRPDANTVGAYDSASADYELSIDALDEIHDISDLLFGIFFEDINFAADGGLYAEMVANRSFEYTELAAGDQLYAYNAVNGADLQVKIADAENGLNENNTNYLVMTNPAGAPAGVENRGFLDGMSIVEGADYSFTVYAKAVEGYEGKLYVNLTADGQIVASGEIEGVTDEWQKYSLTLTSSVTAYENVKLQVLIDNGGVMLDMISLFPEDTYKGRENGLRKDLCVLLEELQPKFLRFPGGCITEGESDETDYDWKDSIGVGKDGDPLYFNGGYGDVAARTQGINLWTHLAATDDPYPCFMTYGLGFYEYFQLAEDIGAVGVPVLNCGLYCQMRGKGPIEMDTPEFEQLIQDMHDLVEFCRGSADTKWGKVRASLGHEEPFELKYIGIGNENEDTVYFERYAAFAESFNEAKKANPDLYDGIELIYSAGASDATHSGKYLSSYEFAKEWLKENPDADINAFAGATDQHYYNEPEWFLQNTDYYDEKNYKRDPAEMTDTIYGGGINVFLGEYAARSNNLNAALAEAAYMTGLERNGDIVRMAAYAPLFGNLTATHWSPDLIWFNNHQSTGSISYYMQKIFSVNAGTKLLSSELNGALLAPEALSGRVGVGTWYTTAEFDNVVVKDNKTGIVLDYDTFTVPDEWWEWETPTDGNFKLKWGKLVQDQDWTSGNALYGSVAYFGNPDWTNYTYTVEAKKTGGGEGFLIPFAVQDKDNCLFWNIGGWGNTISCLQRIQNGVKTGQINGTIKPFAVEEGRTYEIKIVVDGYNVKGYIDGEQYFDYDASSVTRAEAYHVVSTDETGDVIIKLVNTTETNRVFAIDIANGENLAEEATVYQVAGDDLGNDNILGAEEDCVMTEMKVSGINDKFNYTVPQYSVTVIRIHRS